MARAASCLGRSARFLIGIYAKIPFRPAAVGEGWPLTVFQDLIIVATFAVAFAWTAGDEFAQPIFDRPSFRRMILAFIVGWMPVGIYLLVSHYSWSFWYFLSEDDFPLLLSTTALAAEGLACIGAYTLVAALREGGKRNLAIAVTAAIVALVAALLVLPFDRVARVGTYAQFHAGGGVPLFGSTVQRLEWVAIGTWIGLSYGVLIAFNLRGRKRT